MAGMCGVGFEDLEFVEGCVVWCWIRRPQGVVDGWRETAATPKSRAKLVLRGWLRPEVKSVVEFVDYLNSSGPSGWVWYSEAGCVRR
jgi:hypothetical protein